MKIAKGNQSMTGKELYGPVGAKEPVLFNGKLGWIRVFCEKCDRDYDIREVENETTHPYAHHVAKFDCPKEHQCEARRVWHSFDDEFLGACGIERLRQDTYEGRKQRKGESDHGETPEDKERRLALAACLNADVIYRGVRDGLCYFEVYFTDDSDGPKAVLSLPADGLTAEKIANHVAEADRKRRKAE
jgi:hypothetical protein